VVWRVKQAGRGVVLSCAQSAAEHRTSTFRPKSRTCTSESGGPPLSSIAIGWLLGLLLIRRGPVPLTHSVQIFIDEIDSLFRERSAGDHEVTGMMKAEFMTLWDGLTTGSDTRVLVLGATNRPNE
jgi:hypothetical protein